MIEDVAGLHAKFYSLLLGEVRQFLNAGVHVEDPGTGEYSPLQRTDLAERSFPLFHPPPPPDGWDQTMERATGQHDRVWLITVQGDAARDVILDQFRQRFAERSHQTLQHIDVYLFERR